MPIVWLLLLFLFGETGYFRAGTPCGTPVFLIKLIVCNDDSAYNSR